MKKEMKLLGIVLISLILISLVPAVTAQTAGDDVADFFTKLIDGIQKAGEPIFKALLGATETGGDLFVKVLLFLLVTFTIVAVLDSIAFFMGKTWLTWLVAIVISVFGIRFIPAGLIETITFPSTALALIIGLGFPFFIFGYIIQKITDNRILRRIGWVVYGVIIAFLWFYNYKNASIDKFRWLYPAALVACIVAIVIDGTLQKWLGRAEAQRALEKVESVEVNRVRARIADLETALGRATNPGERAKILKQIKEEIENLKSLIGSV